MESRRDERTNLPLQVRVKRWRRVEPLSCLDASYRGLRLSGRLSAGECELIELYVQPPDTRELRMFGRVVRKDGDDIGVELLYTDSVTRAAWERVVRASLAGAALATGL